MLSVLGHGKDEMLAVYLVKSYCLPILLYGCEIWRLSSYDKHKLGLEQLFSENFEFSWQESAKPLLFYCNTMPVSVITDH